MDGERARRYMQMDERCVVVAARARVFYDVNKNRTRKPYSAHVMYISALRYLLLSLLSLFYIIIIYIKTRSPAPPSRHRPFRVPEIGQPDGRRNGTFCIPATNIIIYYIINVSFGVRSQVQAFHAYSYTIVSYIIIYIYTCFLPQRTTRFSRHTRVFCTHIRIIIIPMYLIRDPNTCRYYRIGVML